MNIFLQSSTHVFYNSKCSNVTSLQQVTLLSGFNEDTTEYSPLWLFLHFPLERTTSRIPDRQANKSRAHPEPKFWWIPLLGKQSNPVSRQDISRLPESGTVFWPNLGSRKYPSRPSPNYSTRPLIPPATQATSGSRVPFLTCSTIAIGPL